MTIKKNIDIIKVIQADIMLKGVYMKTKEYTKKTGKLKTFHLEEEVEDLLKISKEKPSSRLIRTRKGRKAIAGLIDIEKNHNHSWYTEIKNRASKNPNALALFYRGNRTEGAPVANT